MLTSSSVILQHNIINLLNPARLPIIYIRIGGFMASRVYLFDTTLRDGEQSPGCSMTVPEKLRLAAKLVELGVDILEAGIPIASHADYEALDAGRREFSWVQVAALAPAHPPPIDRPPPSPT